MKRIIDFLRSQDGDRFLTGLYCSEKHPSQRDRYLSLLEQFERNFPNSETIVILSSPGRTEIGGNHTDHENGRVLAGAIDLDTLGVAARNNAGIVRLISKGFLPLEIAIDDLAPRPGERNTSAALVRGLFEYFHQHGLRIGGMDICMTSDVPGGAGLSSSASFQMLLAGLLNTLYNAGAIDPLFQAQAGRFAESEYFGKPCGLMDQLTCALGGLITIDFKDPGQPQVRKLAADLTAWGYQIVLLDTGGSHADLTDEYIAIRREQRSVAEQFGKSVLREVDESEFTASLPDLRGKVGDRAILRAMHFFRDHQRVSEQVQALEANQVDRFLQLVRESGESSWMLLQNCYPPGEKLNQGIPLALALSAQILGKRGAWRVHGGGFAGTMQAFVPRDLLGEYVKGMERVFGCGACRFVRIRPQGVVRLPLPEGF